MNKELFFWNKWDSEFKTIYQVLLAIVILIIGTYFTAMYLGADFAIDWLTTTQLDSKTIAIGINNVFNIPAPVPTNISVLKQYYQGSPIEIPSLVPYLYLSVFFIGFTVMLTIATYLSRTYFLISIALFIFFLFLLKLNTLRLFGLEGNANPILFFILFTPISYYFQDINKSISLIQRLLTFITLLAISGVIIQFFSQIESPFFYLAHNIYIPAVIITVLFILMIAYEVIYHILIITTQGNEHSKTNNTKHFLILSLIYLINLVFVYMKNAGHIDWDIYYINAFILIIISAVLAIWGIKDRENLYQNTLAFYPYMGLFYLAIAVISLSTMAFQMFQINDPLLEAFEDAIIFGHIGFGSMFLLYIIGNFISFLVKNQPVYRIAFKENNFPLVSARLAGIAIILAFFFYSNKAALNQSIGGYFIGQGDYYLFENNQKTAIRNYRYASDFAIYNHRSNYSLSKLENSKKAVYKSAEIATKKNPTAYAFINTAINFEKEGKFFEALFAYHEGINKFSNAYQINNNIGVLYSGSNITDSAAYYLNQTVDSEIGQTTGLSNKLALSALKGLPFSQTFSSNSAISSERLDVNANILASILVQPDTSLKVAYLSDNNSSLNIISYAYLNNLGIWSFANPNDNFLPLVEAALNNPDNGFYTEQLLFLKAINLYNSGQVMKAYQVIAQLIGAYSGGGKYAYIAGLWSLEQNSPKLATEYLKQSIEQGYQDANLFYPLNLWLNGQSNQAHDFITELSKKDSVDSRLALVKNIIRTDVIAAKQKSKDYFNTTVSLPASNLLDEITVLELENNTANTDRLYTLLGSLNPFYTEGIIEAISHFNKKKEEERSYEIILNAMEINPYSEVLVKTYIDQCFKMGLESYAETGLLSLLDILSKDEYDKYEIIFDLRKDQIQQEEDLHGIHEIITE